MTTTSNMQKLSAHSLRAATGLQSIQTLLQQFAMIDPRGNEPLIDLEDRIDEATEQLRNLSAIANKLENGESIHAMLKIAGTDLTLERYGLKRGKQTETDGLRPVAEDPTDVPARWKDIQVKMLNEVTAIFAQWEALSSNLDIHAGNATDEAKKLYNSPRANKECEEEIAACEARLGPLTEQQKQRLYYHVIEDILPNRTQQQFTRQLEDIQAGSASANLVQDKMENTPLATSMVNRSQEIRRDNGIKDKATLMQDQTPPTPVKEYLSAGEETAREALKNARSRNPIDFAKAARDRSSAPRTMGD